MQFWMIELQSSSSFTIQPHNPEFCTTDFEVVIEKEKIIKKEVIVHFLNYIQCPYLQILLLQLFGLCLILDQVLYTVLISY